MKDAQIPTEVDITDNVQKWNFNNNVQQNVVGNQMRISSYLATL